MGVEGLDNSGQWSGIRKSEGGDFVGERGERLGYELRRGPSRSKDAQDDSVKLATGGGQKQIPPLRCGMTSKRGCGMTDKEQTTAKANTEILAAPE